jgi:hypothetical protein
MRTTFLLVIASAALAVQSTEGSMSAAEAQANPPFKVVASVRQIMTAITIPASDAVFGAAGDAPKSDKEWEKVQQSALALAESGNLLMLPGRSRDSQDWVKESQAMIDAALLAVRAAQAKNTDAISDAGDKIYATCESCHKRYMDKSGR